MVLKWENFNYFFTIKAPDKTVKKIFTVLFLDVM